MDISWTTSNFRPLPALMSIYPGVVFKRYYMWDTVGEEIFELVWYMELRIAIRNTF